MPPSPCSRVIASEFESLGPFMEFALRSRWAERAGQPGVSDFVVGNPHEGVLPGLTAALQHALPPQRVNWHAYTLSDPKACEIVSESLRCQTGVAFEPADIAMTNGAFAGLTVALRLVTDPGDEILYISPPWFFYETIIHSVGAIPVGVPVRGENFDLDVDAIARAITPKTRGVIVNSPHNPTGRIFSHQTFEDLARVLSDASQANGRTVYLFSDEAYRRILFDGRDCPSPTAHYPNAFLIYTYGKTLLAPGERLGYVAMPPTMPDREVFRSGLIVSQIMTGYAFPNALLQHAIAELEMVSIDIAHFQVKRDRMVGGLRDAGYQATEPEGTFYILVVVPGGNDSGFCGYLAERDVFVLPGSLFEMPGYFRISLTATSDMIERALPLFADAMQTFPSFQSSKTVRLAAS